MGKETTAAMKNEVSLGAKIAWSLGRGTGRQFITSLVSTYILVFLTDTYGVGAAAAGAIMTIATIWDAINDPIIGGLADKTRTRWGTYRPYMLLVPLPLSIVSVLLFAAPDLSATGKIVYTAVLYICYGMLVTAIEVPYNATLPAMSKNEMERNDILSLATFIASVAILICTSFTTNFVSLLGGDDVSKGYMLLVGIGGVLMCITSWAAFVTCKEKYVAPKEEQTSLIKNLATLFKVKETYPMLGFWCVGCILFQIVMSASVYYCMYYLMNPALITSYMLMISIGGMVGVMVLMPIILRKVKGSMKKAVTYTQAIAIVCYAISFFAGSRSIPVLYVVTFIACMFSTMTNAYRPMTVVGMTEYTRMRTGQQMNGLLSAISGFSYKCGTAISNALIAGVLAVTGYVAGDIGGQSQATLIGINSVRFLVPLAASVLYIIFIQFYPEDKLHGEKAAE